MKSEVDTFKQLAKQVDAAEAIEFYLDIKEYQAAMLRLTTTLLTAL